MHVFIYEYVTGGGWFEQDEPPAESLLAQAEAMATAVAADFCQLADLNVTITRDARLPAVAWLQCEVVSVMSRHEDQQVFVRKAAEADWTLVIAPETDGVLLRRAKLVESAGGRLLSPPPACIELASSKHRTAQALAKHAVQSPLGDILTVEAAKALNNVGFPLVAKPVDGCGSEGIRLVKNMNELAQLSADGTYRVERFVPGYPASVAVLCGPAGDVSLPACRQRLSQDSRFTYLGGSLPLPEHQAVRAKRLALAAVKAIGPRFGYLGVDLILGEAADGSDDYVIEVNPRLTTSYVGLRAAAGASLAAAMLAVAAGRAPELWFAERTIEFTADGDILDSRRVP
jgi:predicted ATP-grasp superfamily ATP-dependent carboligase